MRCWSGLSRAFGGDVAQKVNLDLWCTSRCLPNSSCSWPPQLHTSFRTHCRACCFLSRARIFFAGIDPRELGGRPPADGGLHLGRRACASLQTAVRRLGGTSRAPASPPALSPSSHGESRPRPSARRGGKVIDGTLCGTASTAAGPLTAGFRTAAPRPAAVAAFRAAAGARFLGSHSQGRAIR